jgi:hypothetical protein
MLEVDEALIIFVSVLYFSSSDLSVDDGGQIDDAGELSKFKFVVE